MDMLDKAELKKLALVVGVLLLAVSIIPYDSSCSFLFFCHRGANPTTYFGWPLVIFRRSSLGATHFDLLNVFLNYFLYSLILIPGFYLARMLWEKYR